MKKQKNKINMGKKLSKKERIRMEQQNAENEIVLKYFLGALIFFSIIAITIKIIL